MTLEMVSSSSATLIVGVPVDTSRVRIFPPLIVKWCEVSLKVMFPIVRDESRVTIPVRCNDIVEERRKISTIGNDVTAPIAAVAPIAIRVSCPGAIGGRDVWGNHAEHQGCTGGQNIEKFCSHNVEVCKPVV
jgi:hypothetical protein